MQERETSQVTESLNNRIATNNEFGDSNLTHWLVKQLQLQEGETILEIGCGTCKHLIEFARILGDPYACTGMDISKDSLATAMVENINKVPIKLIERSMDDLHGNVDMCRPGYNIVMFLYSLYYSKDPWRTLMDAFSFINNDGKIIVMGPYHDNNREWLLFLRQFMPLSQKETKSTPTFMYDWVVKFAWTYFGTVTMKRFVNTIKIETIEDLRKYWKSCIYYREGYDESFEDHAIKFFEKNDAFRYSKVGLLVTMKDKLF